ncbi:type I-C CRISPR-associated protein Cas5c [Thermosynechococcus sp. PKX82]|uniref:type I-C CRISPR-associated protein Cas5c n=2 Tax=Thermosynechococcus TaxID=146785 RepID=UPI002873AB5C|nr:type I-C CRISPR-associated protein Cas5c [Thermosynechococcus sp. PKX82]WNC29223.1 type I-C CRISPR-associated protein Cas5c [Thermosynechococcus sp. PKX82]
MTIKIKSMLSVKVWGDYACFTNPAFKVERVSYPVMTPSAARGVLEAIFWKPEFIWQVEEIHVLKPIRHFSITRNEVNSLQSDRAARQESYRYFADEDRAQRHTLALRDVAYVIKAQIVLRPHVNADIAKYCEQFRRRVRKGQCHHQPYLGTREFSAFFEEPTPADQPIAHSDDLGWMLLDVVYEQDTKVKTLSYWRHDGNGAHLTTGKAEPKFFHARLINGVLKVSQ